MVDLRLLHCVLPQAKPYAAVHPVDIDDGGKFLDGAIARQEVKSKLPPMYLRYGFLMAEDQLPNGDSEKQVLGDCSAEVVSGEEDENGDRVFEIYFSQDNRNYLVKLAFSPDEESDDDDDEDSHQEEGGEKLGSDYYSDDGEETYEDFENDEEEETDEDYEGDDEEETNEDEQSDDEKLIGNRVYELYFPQGNRYYVVRLVFETEEGERFLEADEEFLFVELQRVVGISYDGEEEEDEVPVIDNKSPCTLPEDVAEISRKFMGAKIGEPEEKQSRIMEYPAETAKESKNEKGVDPSSGTFVDPLMILERQNQLVALIVHSSA